MENMVLVFFMLFYMELALDFVAECLLVVGKRSECLRSWKLLQYFCVLGVGYFLCLTCG